MPRHRHLKVWVTSLDNLEQRAEAIGEVSSACGDRIMRDRIVVGHRPCPSNVLKGHRSKAHVRDEIILHQSTMPAQAKPEKRQQHYL